MFYIDGHFKENFNPEEKKAASYVTPHVNHLANQLVNYFNIHSIQTEIVLDIMASLHLLFIRASSTEKDSFDKQVNGFMDCCEAVSANYDQIQKKCEEIIREKKAKGNNLFN